MNEQDKLPSTRREEPFPNDLEGRLDAILNVVNSELKSVTLLHLREQAMNGSEIRTAIRKNLREGVYLVLYPTFTGYCKNSLFPIGMVAREEILEDGSINALIGYSITEAGIKYGLPIAAFSLAYAHENDVSLFSILGPTSSQGDSRAPSNRIKILKFLRNREKVSETEIASDICLGENNILEHFKALSLAGFLRYASSGETTNNKGCSVYEWAGVEDRELKTVRTHVNLTSQVAKKLKELEKADRRTLGELLHYGHPSNISTILRGLEKQGFVRHVGKTGLTGNRATYSEASLLDSGRKFCDEYIKPVEEFLQDKSVPEINAALQRMHEDKKWRQEVLSYGIERYTALSHYVNRKSLETHFEEIMDYVVKHPGSRPKDILSACKLKELGSYLTPLVKSGKLRKEKGKEGEGRVVRYYIVEN
jgi:DNA-binding MarR family transcriptional regulator